MKADPASAGQPPPRRALRRPRHQEELMTGAGSGRRPAALTGAGQAVAAAALAATLGLAATCWVVSVWQMSRMNMGTATPLGSFGFFIAVWAAMMAAMMLPGAAPAVLRRAQAGGARAVPLFVGSYLAVWALAGVLVYVVDRPHGTLVAGLVTIAAGLLRAHAGQAALPPALPRGHPLRARVRAALRRVERRADGHAGGAGRDEHPLDGGDHRSLVLAPENAARERATMCHWRWRSSGWESSSSSRPRRFLVLPRPCERPGAALATASRHGKQSRQ